MSEFPHVLAECVGTDSELAGKAAGCEGCPNQEACATAPKGPDPGALAAATSHFLPVPCIFASAGQLQLDVRLPQKDAGTSWLPGQRNPNNTVDVTGLGRRLGGV